MDLAAEGGGEDLSGAAAEVADDGDVVVIGADTVVVIDGVIVGKPADAADAAAMLRRLSGRTHQVVTGVAIVKGGVHESFVEVTDVTFADADGVAVLTGFKARCWKTGKNTWITTGPTGACPSNPPASTNRSKASVDF